MTARPMTEVEREEQIARVIFSHGQHFFSDRDWAIVMARRRSKAHDRETPHPAPTELDRAFSMAREINALLSTSASLRGMREALTDAAAHLAGAASAYRRHAARHRSQGRAVADALFSTRADDFDRAARRASAALSGIEPGDELARSASHRSAPASTLSKDTTK